MAIALGITSNVEDGPQGWQAENLRPNPPSALTDSGADSNDNDALLGPRMDWIR